MLSPPKPKTGEFLDKKLYKLAKIRGLKTYALEALADAATGDIDFLSGFKHADIDFTAHFHFGRLVTFDTELPQTTT